MQPHTPAPRDFSACSQVTTDTVQLHNRGLDCWEKSCMRKNCKKGMVEPSLLRSWFQFSALSLDPCQGSLPIPGHVPPWSRLDPDSLTCFHSLDLHFVSPPQICLATPGLLADPHCYHQTCCPLLWVLWDWTFVSAITALHLPLVTLGSWRPFLQRVESILLLLLSDSIFKCRKKS